MEVRGHGEVSCAASIPTLTCDGPKVEVTFVLASGEGYDVLGTIVMEIHGTQLLDALISQHTNPALCGGQQEALCPGVWTWDLGTPSVYEVQSGLTPPLHSLGQSYWF